MGTQGLSNASSLDLSTTSSAVEVRRVAISSYIGNTIEFYDFMLYGLASALVFGQIFFSNLPPVFATIASFATLAAGYVARPLGGVIFGHFGDRAGRKAVLLTTMIMMGTASGLIGLLPTYDQIGVAAPMILVFLRLIQGVAVGGEWGGASLMAAEHAPRASRGLITGISQTGLSTGGFLATVVVALITLMPRDDLLSWGWRVPFIVSFALLGVGIFVRIKISESPLFVRLGESNRVSRQPLMELLLARPKTLIRATVAALGPITISSIFGFFVIAHATSIGYDRSTVVLGVTIGWGATIVAMPLFGALSDRVGRRPVYLVGAVGYAVMAFPLFWMINSRSTILLFLAITIALGVLSCAMAGPLVALLSEWFNTSVRFSGLSVSYQIATVVAGLCPLLASTLLAVAGGGTNTSPISLMMLVIGAGGTVVVWLVPESNGQELSQVDATLGDRRSRSEPNI